MRFGRSRPAAKAPPAAGPAVRRPWLAAAVVAAVVAGGAAAVVFWPRPPAAAPPDPAPEPAAAPPPPLTASPFLNTRPGVAYVGDAACAGCHADLCAAYHRHPMGRSLHRAAAAPPAERVDAPTNPFRVGPYHYQVLRDGDRVVHREWCEDAAGSVVAEARAEAAYAVGSGTQSRSYLVARDGFLFESPITWYVRSGAWGLSPGYAANNQHFGRRIDARCLYCHCGEARPVAGTVNEYARPPFAQLAIGCERCHGPGALHAAARAAAPPAAGVDDTIVNPKHLAPALREAVCEQCHLQGEAIVPRRGRAQADYRPGLPLDESVRVFTRPPGVEDATRIVSHAEQTRQSGCAAGSGGRFGCTSCHDPHRPVPAGEAAAYYRDRCRACHHAPGPAAGPGRDCALPAAARAAVAGVENCVACHMPRGPSTTPHLAVTDHRVLRRPDRPPPPPPARWAAGIPLIPFHPAPADEDFDRDLALAAVHLADLARDQAPGVADALTARALPLLERAAARDPGDVPALEGLGFARSGQGRPDALDAFDAALARAPDREQALAWAADATAARGQNDRAEGYARRLVARYPHYPPHRGRLAVALGRRGAWAEAAAEAAAAVRADPFRGDLRAILIESLVGAGDAAGARAELACLAVIDPAAHARLLPRVADRLK